MIIQLLDQNTINKIAAGEVVERPASIVKELVENSIDAGATAITVEIKDGGMKMVRITDNGSGIVPDDIKSAFLRHTTSKIKNVDDLLTISSLGFRGEALASIAAVSQVELITKIYDNVTGIRYIIEGGLDKSMEEIGCPDGTTFIIKNLFYNVPARRKFLKTPMTEASYISELMNKLALGNPHISFKFINNHQVKLHTSGNNKLKDCIFSVFGKDIAKSLIKIDYSNENFEIKGFIGKPVICRANRNYENYYINGRYIKSKVVQKAIEDAYKSKLTLHKYPFTTFHMNIDPKYIDVNVHPTKMDIRFNNEMDIYNAIYNTLIHALNQSELIPEVSFEEKKKISRMPIQQVPEPFEKKRIEAYKQINEPSKVLEVSETTYNDNNSMKEIDNEISNEISNASDNVAHDEPSHIDKVIDKGQQVEFKEELFINSKAIAQHKIVGQLFGTYWIVEFNEKYYIIDQHAAHERVLYEKIIKGLKDKTIYSQGLLQPIIVNLTMKEKLRFEVHENLFKDLGFEIESFGGDSVAIRSVPYIFEKPINPNDFMTILDKLDDEYKEDKYDILLDNIASMSCKAAVKANDKMSSIEYHQLIDELLTLENPFHCPHGRPTIIAMTKYELEKKFKRIQ